MDSLELAHLLVDVILEKKGGDITLLDIHDQAVFANYFLICSGDNERQLRTLADSLTFEAKKQAKVFAQGVEGEAHTGWLLVDFGDLVVHLFLPATRAYYDLEDLWSDAHVVLRMH